MSQKVKHHANWDGKVLAIADKSYRYKNKHSFYRRDEHNNRTYQMEKDNIPKPMTEKQKIRDVHNNNVSASSIYKLEQFLQGIEYRLIKQISPKERERIVKEYSLTLNDSKNQWGASKKDVFEKLKEKYQNAGYYLHYSELWGSYRNLQPLRHE